MNQARLLQADAIRVERRALSRRLGWSALALLLVPIPLLVVLKGLDLHTLWRAAQQPSGIAMLLSPLAGLAALAARFFRPARPGSIGVVGGSLVYTCAGRERSVPLASLRAGWFEPLARQVVLEQASGDRIRVDVARDDQARRLLEATGLGPAQRTMRMRLGDTVFLDWMAGLLGPSLGIPIARAVASLVPHQAFQPAAVLLAIVGVVISLVVAVRLAFGPADLVIGADGITIEHRYRRRFLPYRQIASARTLPRAVVIGLTDGSVIEAKARNLSAADVDRLQSRLAEAAAAAEHADVAQGALAQLERAGRSVAEWREALAGLLGRAHGYREATVSRDELMAALESPSAGGERRLGAAIALAGAAPEERSRIAAAASACANGKVRIALEAVARGEVDDGVIEEALAEEERASAAGHAAGVQASVSAGR